MIIRSYDVVYISIKTAHIYICIYTVVLIEGESMSLTPYTED